jgi:signal transduction histidine kinase
MTGRGDLTEVPILDSPGGHDLAGAVEVALLDLHGTIVRTNSAWDHFCRDNDGDLARAGIGSSYLDACAAGGDDPAATEVADAILCALGGDLPAPLSILVPCDSPTEPRVFRTLISSRLDDEGICIGATVTLSRVPALHAEHEAFPPQDLSSLRAWTPDALPALLRIAEVVPEETTLAQTLRRLAESARDLLGVAYAAVGISGPGGVADELAHAGVHAQLLPQRPSPADVSDWLQQQPHFLSRDVVLTGRRLATLYVAGASHRGSSRVERLADSFIEAAGTAIENARVYQASERGQRWAEAAAELIQELVSRAPSAPLDVLLSSAAKAAEADLAVILVPHDDAHVRLHAIVGGREGISSGKLFARHDSAAAEVMLTGAPLLLERRPAQIDLVSDRPMGPVAVVPLAFDRTIVGALVVSRVLGRPPFAAADVDALSRFCEYAGVALDIERTAADREQTNLHDDRTRIAHELHDQVVRQLFAVGMGLEGLIESLHDSELRGRVSGYVAALDESIRGIRETVYQTGGG